MSNDNDPNVSDDAPAGEPGDERTGAPPPPPPSEPGAIGASSFTPPTPPLWRRIPLRLLIGGPILLLIVIVGWWTSRGETSADDLQAGDCFAIPEADEFERVTNQSCDEPHEGEVLVVVNMPAGSGWPGSGTQTAVNAAFDTCDNQIATLDLIDENIPNDAGVNIFFTGSAEWNGGDRELVCYIYSPSMLTGSVLAP
ncbi:MAG: septum formation family protein [Actinomycetota bacterium]